jgi:hypothetical protein
MVHNVPLPWDSTSRAIIVNTSDNSEPARISFRMPRTDSLEKKSNSFCARVSFVGSCAEAGFIVRGTPNGS